METALLIRKPVDDVFGAIVDPAQTTQFWFTKSSGRLDEHERVTWTWEMYNVSAEIKVLAVEPGQKITMAWDNGGTDTTVEWIFTPIDGKGTFLEIRESGYAGDDDTVLSRIKDSTGGFVLVLAGLKAWLEHGIRLNLTADRFPPEMTDSAH
ncbi:SRPBCC family protein [Pedobacter sp. SYP-B3415]|uniref:SRPBCC family protein n=1 Tax=Pedobacter sp. SYP-B3415 TaxID=2496641 RepID=UPI001F0FFB36|nr:SRPBCC family protein [Pedobacter sp. SYP-B3415]